MQLYCEKSWLENRHIKRNAYLTKFKISAHFHDSLPYSSVVFFFFLKFYFPDNLIATEVFYLPKQQKVKTVVGSTECVSFLTHDSVVVASKRWRFQYSQIRCGKRQKSLNRVSDGKWGRRTMMSRVK